MGTTVSEVFQLGLATLAPEIGSAIAEGGLVFMVCLGAFLAGLIAKRKGWFCGITVGMLSVIFTAVTMHWVFSGWKEVFGEAIFQSEAAITDLPGFAIIIGIEVYLAGFFGSFGSEVWRRRMKSKS